MTLHPAPTGETACLRACLRGWAALALTLALTLAVRVTRADRPGTLGRSARPPNTRSAPWTRSP